MATQEAHKQEPAARVVSSRLHPSGQLHPIQVNTAGRYPRPQLLATLKQKTTSLVVSHNTTSQFDSSTQETN